MTDDRTEAQLRASAELVVDTCFEVTDGDVVTIITDDRRKPEAEMVATVVAERGGLPIVANNETQIRRALADTHFPMVPPRNLHQAMVTSDQIIIMTNLEWANRFAHVPAVKESVANMARIGSIEEGFGRWPISVADIEATIGNAKKAIARLEGKKRVRVTSPAGTDVVVSIERRPALEVVPVKQPGAMMGPAPLWGEVAYAAVEDQTNGTIVIDGNMLGIGIPRHVEHPITWHVEDGKYRAIEGGAEARRLLDVITGVPGTETVAEFAFGTSDFAPVGDPSEKGRKGTVHFALGDNQNCYPGGQNRSVLHLDGVCHNVSLQILDTGEYLVKDGVLAAMTEVSVITLADVPPVELAGGSWSRVLVADSTVGGNASALGYSVFKPGTSTADLSHEVEELAYIVSGRGVIRLEAGDVPVAAGQALYVPAKLWHTVVNPGDEDLVMVFSFPSPAYPPTERRASR